MSQHNRRCTPLRNAHLTAAEILALSATRAHVAYFSHPAYRAALAAKFSPGAVTTVDKMLEYRLERDLLK
jgi:hypothetical protein